jgi:hypothetical protein
MLQLLLFRAAPPVVAAWACGHVVPETGEAAAEHVINVFPTIVMLPVSLAL